MAAEIAAPETFFADRDERDWDRLLAATETRRFRPGEIVLPDGVPDRALYLLADGRLEVVRPGARGVLATLEAPATGVSIRTWWAIRVASITAALVVAGLLIASPDDGLFVMWKLVIPLLPLLFMVAPGVWRNICPLAASNQTPRVLGLTRGLTAPKWLKEYGYVVAISLFVLFVVLRKVGLDDNGPASALLLLGALAGR